MSYYKTKGDAEARSYFNIVGNCFACSKAIDGPTVSFDGYTADGKAHSIYMHRDCAFLMAQSLILDAWPNRRDGHRMSLWPESNTKADLRT